MIEFRQWCSVFCTGTAAVGDISIEFDGGVLSLPVCADCLTVLQENPERALELEPLDVIELDPEDQAQGLIPRE